MRGSDRGGMGNGGRLLFGGWPLLGSSAPRGARHGKGRWAATFWSFFAIVLVLLGFDKQLDLQTWFTLIFKYKALNEGWFTSKGGSSRQPLLAPSPWPASSASLG